MVEHVVALIAAFDTAAAFGVSFGVAKFQLAQREGKLVGEIVGRYGRSPNPAIVRAIKAWPPVYNLKQLQEFLGTVNYVRPHAGPEYSRIADPLRALLKPGAEFPPNEKQVAAIEKLKQLVVEHHRLAGPDEAAARGRSRSASRRSGLSVAGAGGATRARPGHGTGRASPATFRRWQHRLTAQACQMCGYAAAPTVV